MAKAGQRNRASCPLFSFLLLRIILKAAMKRPIQHEIETASRRQFEQSLPTGWVARWQDADYGIDAEVEVFSAGVSTGVIFKVQVKGTVSPQHLKGQRAWACRLHADQAKYLSQEILIPAVLVLAEVTRQRSWWYCPQTDEELLGRLARAGSQQTITLHVPDSNDLQRTPGELLKAVRACEIILAHANPAYRHGVRLLLSTTHLHLATLSEMLCGSPTLSVPLLVLSTSLDDFLRRAGFTLEVIDDPEATVVVDRLRSEGARALSGNTTDLTGDRLPDAFGVLPGNRVLMSTRCHDWLRGQHGKFKESMRNAAGL